jgi:hypothetical protein
MCKYFRLAREVLTVQARLCSVELVEFLFSVTLIQPAPASNGYQRHLSRVGHPKCEVVISLSCNTEISNGWLSHAEHDVTLDNKGSFVSVAAPKLKDSDKLIRFVTDDGT